MFDVKEPGRGAPTMAHGRVGRDWAVISLSMEDRAGGTLTRAITSFRRIGRAYRRRDETHRLTLLPTRELTRRLRAVGCRVRIARGYGGARLPPGYAVLVARKPKAGAAPARRASRA
ncbi:MAG: hypothetical protein HY271_18970 [Deltaproteobacteria bacterium]|nr:hypothetical protein [Deltaproteobacteria bacterium]